MGEWHSLVQIIVETVDAGIQKRENETITLSSLSHKLGYSEWYISHKFVEISGMRFRDYLRQRTLAFALKEVRDSTKGLLDIALAESYGARLPADYRGEVPEQMLMMDVPEGEYIVFEHGPFDLQTHSQSVEQKIEAAMEQFDYDGAGYCLDTTQGRVFYFYHDPHRFWKYIRPVKKLADSH